MNTIDMVALRDLTSLMDDDELAAALFIECRNRDFVLTTRAEFAKGASTQPVRGEALRLMLANIGDPPPAGHVGVLPYDNPPIINVRVRDFS